MCLIALCFLLGKCEVMKILTMCFWCVIPYEEIDPCVPLRGCTPSGRALSGAVCENAQWRDPLGKWGTLHTWVSSV